MMHSAMRLIEGRDFRYGVLLVILALPIFFFLLPRPTRQPPSKRMSASSDIRGITQSLENYRVDYGIIPTSDHVRIIQILRGDNPKKIVFINFADSQRSSEGHFLDPWGTPYRIDISNPQSPRVYSAGENKKDEPADPHSDDVRSWQ